MNDDDRPKTDVDNPRGLSKKAVDSIKQDKTGPFGRRDPKRDSGWGTWGGH